MIQTPELKLYAVFVGGKHERANIELHDVQFVVARSIEETAPALKQRWWGRPDKIHIDAYAEITEVDGVRITPVPRSEAKPASSLALYFVNTGGYEAGVFGELHAYSFHVSTDKKAVWREARGRVAHYVQPHQDNFDIIDDLICVDEAIQDQPYTLTYEPIAGAAKTGPRIVAEYMKL